ncbi:MAG: VanZ family protein [Thermodesulfobacteriota bacterium]
MAVNVFYRALLTTNLLGIVIASLLPGSDQVVGDWDKAGHLFMYSSLSFIICLNFFKARQRAVALLSGIALGALMEICQSFIPGRAGSMFDQIANTMGVLIGTALFFIVGKRLDVVLKRFLKRIPW